MGSEKGVEIVAPSSRYAVPPLSYKSSLVVGLRFNEASVIINPKIRGAATACAWEINNASPLPCYEPGLLHFVLTRTPSSA